MVRPIQTFVPMDATDLALILHLVATHREEIDLDRAFVDTLERKCGNAYYSLMGKHYGEDTE